MPGRSRVGTNNAIRIQVKGSTSDQSHLLTEEEIRNLSTPEQRRLLAKRRRLFGGRP
jgi:hypothetical protein